MVICRPRVVRRDGTVKFNGTIYATAHEFSQEKMLGLVGQRVMVHDTEEWDGRVTVYMCHYHYQRFGKRRNFTSCGQWVCYAFPLGSPYHDLMVSEKKPTAL